MRLAIAACLAGLLAVALAAQTPQKPAPQQPTFKAGVSLVWVDVYPTANDQAIGDLRKEEFDVREDGVPQKIETFERVVLNARTAEIERDEPVDVEESNEAAANPRNRVFVLFYDTLHTYGYGTPGELAGLARNRSPWPYDPRTTTRALSAFFHRLIGPDDLVGVLTPQMAVDALTFSRRPSSFDEFLMTGAHFEQHVQDGFVDDTEREYATCGPAMGPAMIAMRRRNLTIGALRNLVIHLQNLREGRKFVIVVSEGWTVQINPLMRNDFTAGPPPVPPKIGIIDGKPTIGDPRDYANNCSRAMQALAAVDIGDDFRDLLMNAGRTNVTFYPIDPHGLRVESSMNLKTDSLMSLASATDGPSVINLNDPSPALKRVSDTLSTYYLLSYSSTNAKFDGKFRKISVQVKRRGVRVRARPGYLAPTEAEVAARAKPVPPLDPAVDLRNKTLALLGTERPDAPLRIAAGYGFGASINGQPPRPAVWIIGELDRAAARAREWSGGADATITVTDAGGKPAATAQAAVVNTAPRFLVHLADMPLGPGDYLVKVRLRAKADAAGDVSAQMRVSIPDITGATSALLGRPMLFRRGPYTGAGYQPTADLRFRKAEWIRVEVPIGAAVESVATQLLDRRGQTLPIPVTTGQREDGGRRFLTAEITLAPFAPADYLVEVSARSGEKTEKVLTAFRIVP